jgi:hypothetical protein
LIYFFFNCKFFFENRLFGKFGVFASRPADWAPGEGKSTLAMALPGILPPRVGVGPGSVAAELD